MHQVLFVCLGNICRSPMAEGIFRALVQRKGLANQFHVDSAGTGDWHTGLPPDERAQRVALQRGIDLSSLRARKVCVDDMQQFDTIVAMDRSNLTALKTLAGTEYADKLHLLLAFAPEFDTDEVPDPYYGRETGFDEVADMIAIASTQLLRQIRLPAAC